MRESEIFGKKVKISGRLIRNRRDKKIVKTGWEVGSNMALLSVGDFQETDDKFDRDEFDIKIGKKNYRVVLDAALDKVWCREIDSYDYTGRALFRNPPIEDGLVKDLIEFVNSSPVPERNKLITVSKFAREYREQRLKSKSKAKRRGRKEKDYIKRATVWAIENQLKNESFTKVARRAYQEFRSEAHSEAALVSSLRSKQRSWKNLYKEKHPLKRDEDGKWKKRVSFRTFIKRLFKPA
jgi:hypothetical protein